MSIEMDKKNAIKDLKFVIFLLGLIYRILMSWENVLYIFQKLER